MTSGRIDHVAVIGGGFSGALLAINLLRREGPRVTLIERRDVIARGTAYSTLEPTHLLNVRASNMSAFPDDPTHFVQWRAARAAGAQDEFASRRDYGAYLSELLEGARQQAPGRLELVRGNAVELGLPDARAEITLESGRHIAADAAVLAIGNLPPLEPTVISDAALPGELYQSDPWRADLAAGLTASDDVLILGTGLTMVDVVLSLAARGFEGRIMALSRHGLLPRAHEAVSDIEPVAPPENLRGALMLRWVRERARLIGWRAAMDALRPFTQDLWRSASADEQQRFLRHLRPWWDVHRHRLAPPVAGRLGQLLKAGRLEVLAGRLASCAVDGNSLEVAWRRRGDVRAERRAFRLIVNCTGPRGDPLRSREPLLRLLLAAGYVRPDRQRLGVDVTTKSETVDVRGKPNSRLLALGPMTRGAFWEISAVPDIRRQAWTVAQELLGFHQPESDSSPEPRVHSG